jgi:hypothetical protein
MRAQRSNPLFLSLRGKMDCFASLAMTAEIIGPEPNGREQRGNTAEQRRNTGNWTIFLSANVIFLSANAES